MDLAKKLDTTKQYINALANGSANPTIGTLQKIAKALNVELIDLIEGKRMDSESCYECPHCKRKFRIVLEEVD